MDDHNRCRGCGKERPADAPAGLCPICLFRAGQVGATALDYHDEKSSDGPADLGSSSGLVDLNHPFGYLHDAQPANSEGGHELSGRSGRLYVLEPIGRGGMGVVHKGRDSELGRELAVKVLLDRYRDHPAMIQRFVDEAQISGQLQHPGVVPVYEIGVLSDHRPYFAMKLIKGRTLAELLAGRACAEENLPGLLSIFEAVCQTVAYAHARGVLHRDLKPSNIMVGSFGEVQVMDWGAAKLLGQRDDYHDLPTPTADLPETVIATRRSRSDVNDSRAGTVIGTPAYMSPEQARGQIDAVDERADVFALGSILCEILTGRPAFHGETSEEIERCAARGDLALAYSRLDRCGADAELVALARESLSSQPAGRPRDAQVVAGRITAYRSCVQEKLRAAELAAVEAQARADEESKRRGLADRLAEEAVARASLERRRRRLSLALAGTTVALILLCAGAAIAFLQVRQARLAKVDLILKEAELLHEQASRDPDGDIGKWQAAQAALARARELMDAVPLGVARSQLDELASRIETGAAAAERDRKLISRLEDIRAGLESDQRADSAYAGAFRGNGIDLVSPTIDAVAIGRTLAARPKGITRSVAGALDAWALVRRGLTSAGDASGWAVLQNLLAVARAADPDPWRDALHEALSRSDPTPLVRLTKEPALEQIDPAKLWFLGYGLEILGEHTLALEVLERAQRTYPDDFWLNTELGLVCMDAKRSGPAATSSLIAAGTNPASARLQDAETYFTAAVALRPQFASAHHLLGGACQLQGKWDQAIACYRRALRLQPNDATIYNSLGNVLVSKSNPDEAVAAYRAAIRLSPGYELPYINLLSVLASQGKTAEAINICREAIRSAPAADSVRVFLGDFLLVEGNVDEAAATYEEAKRRVPANPQVHDRLGSASFQQGKLDFAIAEYRESIRLAPGFADPRAHLAQVLVAQGKLDLGIESYREAIALAPQFPAPHINLGLALRKQGDFEHAAAELRTALELAADPGSREMVERELSKTERWHLLAKQFADNSTKTAATGNPAEDLDRAYYFYERQRYAKAANLFQRSIERDPALIGDINTQNRYNAACACLLAAASQGKDELAPAEADQAHLRRLAYEYLEADLAKWKEYANGSSPASTVVVRQTLRHWTVDPDLASVRDADALARIPEAPRKQWRSLWERVANFLKPAA